MLIIGGMFFILVGILGIVMISRAGPVATNGALTKLLASRLADPNEYYRRVGLLACCFFIIAGVTTLFVAFVG
jgi:hypothetical protein